MSGETERVCSPLRSPRQIVACEVAARVCEGEPNGDDGGYVMHFSSGTARPPDRESCYRIARSAGRAEWRLLPRGSEGLFRPSATSSAADAVIVLTGVEQARREILGRAEPVWVITGGSYCQPCHIMKEKMAKANSAGGMKVRIAYVDYDKGEGAKIIRELGLEKRFNDTKSIPKLLYLGLGRGRAKKPAALHELFPDNFKGIDIARDKNSYMNRCFRVWDEIIERIAGGGDGR